MEEHHIHDIKVGFHGGTEEARSFLKHDLSRDGAQRLFTRAREKGEDHFMVDGAKFKVISDKEGNLSIDKSHI